MKVDDYSLKHPLLLREDIRFILSEILDIPPSRLTGEYRIEPEKAKQIEDALKRLESGEPPQYIVGRAWFYGLPFYVDSRVLIPRFDSEVLVEAVAKHLKGDEKVLEIGVGSGALSIALKSIFPDLRVHATDISADALEVAKINIQNHNMEIKLHHADLFPKKSEKSFDLIISNPPYICAEEYELLEDRVKRFEPKLALFSENGARRSYERICAQAANYLTNSGILAFEHGYNQQKCIVNLTESHGFKTLQMGKDLASRDRFIIAKLRS